MSPSLSWIDGQAWSGLLDGSGLRHTVAPTDPALLQPFVPQPGPMEDRLRALRHWISRLCFVDGFVVADESGLPLTGGGDPQEALVVFNLLGSLQEVRRHGRRVVQGITVFLQEGGYLYLFEARKPGERFGLSLSTPQNLGRQELEAIHRAFAATLT